MRHWSQNGREVLVLGAVRGDPRDVVASWRSRGVAAALLQYVPFLYGRRGLSRFPAALARAAREGGIRLTAFVHEPWVPPTRLPWLVLSPLQRRQLLALLRLSDAAATPVPAWVSKLRKTPSVIHVGSTLGEPPPAPAGPLLPAPVLFSPFAAGLAWPWIVAAVRAIQSNPPLIVIGGDAEAVRRHPVAGRWFDPRWDYRGFLPSPDVLALLARARVVLAPFIDGLTGRRTSALAALSVGARTVSSRGHLYDALFDASPATLANTKEAFASAAMDAWARGDSAAQRQERLRWYHERLDPQKLDACLLQLVLGTSAS